MEKRTDDELIHRVRRFVGSLATVEIGLDDDFFALGLVNSLRALEIVVFVEGVLGAKVTVDDLDLDNFRTVRRITRFVAARQPVAG